MPKRSADYANTMEILGNRAFLLTPFYAETIVDFGGLEHERATSHGAVSRGEAIDVMRRVLASGNCFKLFRHVVTNDTLPEMPKEPSMFRPTFSELVVAAAIVVACMGALRPRQAAAVLLASESFSYGTDTELLDKNGGTGFAGGWTAGPGNIAGSGGTAGLTGDNTSLAYPTGTLLNAAGSRYVAAPLVSDNDWVRILTTPIDMSTEGVHYFSYMGNKQNLSGSSDFMIVGFNANTFVDQFTTATDARAAEIGWGSNDAVLLATHPGAPGTYGSSPLTGTGAGAQINKNMLMVLKIVSHAGATLDEVSGYIFSATAGDAFPDIVSNEPVAGSWMVTRTMESSQTLDRIRIMSGNNLGGQIDEIRYGTTWADVVAPDPAAQPSTFTWNQTAAGDWTNSGNWLPSGVIPNGNHEVVFGNTIINASTVYTDQNVTVRAIKFESAVSYGIAGQGTITLDKGTSANAAINVVQGSHEIQAALNVTSPLTITASAATVLDVNNSVNIGANTISVSGAGTVNFNSQVSGSGTISSSATIGTGGATTINGNLASTGNIVIDIFGDEPWSFDSFDVNGTATLGGTLSVDVHDGFVPSGFFDVLTANALVNNGLVLAGPDAGLFSLSVDTTSGIVRLSAAGLVGDFNDDGNVDAADYVVWRSMSGQFGPGLAADADGDNDVDSNDYSLWKANFGSSTQAASAVSSAKSQYGAVPEPGIAALLIIGAIGMIEVRYRRLSAGSISAQ